MSPSPAKVYAIVRVDAFLGADAIDSGITVKRIMRDFDAATKEAARLNALHADGQVRYSVQTTRLEVDQ